MKVYFLDKKMVDDIRNHLTLRIDQGVALARTVDEEHKTVSPLLALLSNKLLNGQKTQQLVDQMAVDVKPLEKFYKKAQVDSEFLQAHKFNLVAPFCNSAESKLSQSIAFIWFLQQRLGDVSKVENHETVRDEILAMAAEHQVESGNPLVITALAALYGHKLAQQIIRKDSASLADQVPLSPAQIDMINIFLLPELISLYSKQVWGASDIPSEVSYALLTSNKAVNEFINSLEVVGTPIIPKQGDVECEYGMGLTTDFFPLIQDDEEQIGILVQKIIHGAEPAKVN